MVLSQYTVKFLRPLKANDQFTVTCDLFTDKNNLPKLHFKQSIILNGKNMTTAIFTGTCVPASYPILSQN
jgi:acyl-CoA thioester hydrolase